MLEYSLQEAKELLENKLSTAEDSLKTLLEDLEFLREQVTTIEVSILLNIEIKVINNIFFINEILITCYYYVTINQLYKYYYIIL
jgi:hypothetical protein